MDTSDQLVQLLGTQMENSKIKVYKKNLSCKAYFRIAIAYCNLEFLAIQPETPRASYIFNIGNLWCLIT